MNKSKPKYRQIIDAAVVVIAEHGYHQAQVSKIAKQAGVADGTIYLYFKNKEDILISLFQEKLGTLIEAAEEKIKQLSDPKAKLLVLIETHFECLSSDKQLATVTQLELRQTNITLRHKINEILKSYLRLIDNILIEGKESGQFRANLDNRIARQMIFGAMDESVTTWVMNEYKYDLKKVAVPLHQMLLQGCAKLD